MRLRAIRLTNVRRFADRTATVEGIGDGIAVLAAPNEFGKSTVFDALHALFFQPHRTRQRAVTSLQPDPGGGAVRISADIELPEGLFRIDKRFLSAPRARITDLASGRVLAQEDEAEAWIAGLAGEGLDGPAGLLWVRQGITGFDQEDRQASERNAAARRDLLSSVAGEIDAMTGGRRMDRVLSRARAALGDLATATDRPKTGGPWKAALDEVAELEGQVEDLSARVRLLGDALTERRRSEARLAEIDRPEDRAARQAQISAARTALTEAEAHASRLRQAEQDHRIALLQLEEAQRAITAQDAAVARADRLAAERADLEQESAEARAALVEADAGMERTVATQKAAEAEVARLRAAEAASQRAARGAEARARLAELEARLAQAEDQRGRIEAGRAAIAASPVTPDKVTALDRARTALAQAQARAEAGAVTLRLDGAGAVTLDGAPLVPGETRALVRRGVLGLPDGGRITVDPGARGAEDTAVAEAEAALARVRRACGDLSPEAAAAALRARQEAEAAVRTAEGILATIAPDGIEALRTAVEQARRTAADSPEALPEADPANLAARLATAEDRLHQAREAATAARQARALAAERVAVIRTRAEGLMQHDAEVMAAAGPVAERAARRATLEQAQRAAATAEARTRSAMADLAAAAPDLQTARAALARAGSAAKASEAEIASLRERLAGLTATIRAEADPGVEEALAEATGRLQAARARATRYGDEAAALRRLVDMLDTVRAEAREAYFGPVQEELRPLLAILHEAAALEFDPDRMLPGALTRQGLAEDIARLSGGTQEQIAVLTRLAFARLFRRAGRDVPVILDDALVHSDDARIEAMFTALHRVAEDQQILVLTCRTRAFAALGGQRLSLAIGPAED